MQPPIWTDQHTYDSPHTNLSDTTLTAITCTAAYPSAMPWALNPSRYKVPASHTTVSSMPSWPPGGDPCYALPLRIVRVHMSMNTAIPLPIPATHQSELILYMLCVAAWLSWLSPSADLAGPVSKCVDHTLHCTTSLGLHGAGEFCMGGGFLVQIYVFFNAFFVMHACALVQWQVRPTVVVLPFMIIHNAMLLL